jgi:uncharacterized integral membrane protein
MSNLKIFFYILLLLLLLVFVLQNYATLTANHSLHLNLGIVSLESVPLPFYLTAFLLFVMGFLLAGLLYFFKSRNLKKEIKSLQNLNRTLEAERERLKNRPDPSPQVKTPPPLPSRE